MYTGFLYILAQLPNAADIEEYSPMQAIIALDLQARIKKFCEGGGGCRAFILVISLS